MTLNFPKSIYTAGDATGANISPANANPTDGDTGTIGSYGFTFDADRVAVNDGRWVMNNGSTYSLTGGATYTWDLYKWKASNIPDSSNVVQTTSTPSNGKVLKWNGTEAVWDTDNNTTYSNFSGADASNAGSAGLVPAPNAGEQTKYLRADGTWETPPDTDTDTTYSAATTSAEGLMSASDKSKLDGIATGANVGVAASGGTFTGAVDFEDAVTEKVRTASTLIDCSTGNYFIRTQSSGSISFVFDNPPASGKAYSFVLELTHGVTHTSITWPNTVKWPNGTSPTFASGKTSLFIFLTDDGGSRWRGAALTDYDN